MAIKTSEVLSSFGKPPNAVVYDAKQDRLCLGNVDANGVVEIVKNDTKPRNGEVWQYRVGDSYSICELVDREPSCRDSWNLRLLGPATEVSGRLPSLNLVKRVAATRAEWDAMRAKPQTPVACTVREIEPSSLYVALHTAAPGYERVGVKRTGEGFTVSSTTPTVHGPTVTWPRPIDTPTRFEVGHVWRLDDEHEPEVFVIESIDEDDFVTALFGDGSLGEWCSDNIDDCTFLARSLDELRAKERGLIAHPTLEAVIAKQREDADRAMTMNRPRAVGK